MEYIFLAMIVFIILLDASTLQEENNSLYTKVLKRSPQEYGVLSFLLFIVIAPIYYFKRKKMISLIKSDNKKLEIDEYKTPNFSLITEASGIVLEWCFLTLAIAGLVYLLPMLSDTFKDELFTNDFLGQLTDIILICLMYIAIKNNRKEGFFKSIHFNKVNLPAKFIIYPVLIAFFFIAVNAVHNNYQTSEIQTPLGKALKSGSDFSVLFFIATAIFLAPLFEEIIFRGYFFTVIKEIKGSKYAVIIISLLFAFFHVEQLWGDWISILVILCLSFCLTYLRDRSDSIIPGLIAHYTYNTFLILSPVLISYF